MELSHAQWCDLAVFYTEMASRATIATQKETLASRAVASLRLAIEQGYLRTALVDDKRFQTLAHREDFRNLTVPKEDSTIEPRMDPPSLTKEGRS